MNVKGTLGYLVLFCPEDVNVSWVGWLLPQLPGFAMQHLGLHDSSFNDVLVDTARISSSFALVCSHLNTLLW